MNTKNDNETTYGLMEGIAIIGMAGCFPGSSNIQSFWQNLQDGVESLSSFSDEELIVAGIPTALINDSNYVKIGGVLENVDLFDAAFFDLNPKEAEVTDPQHRLFLECAWEALENAGYDSTKCESRIGVYAGASLNNYLSFDLNHDQLGSGESYQKLIGNDKGFLSTRVSYKLNLTGPSITVQTACSTSLVATTLACQSLQNYQCDMALAGGVSIRLPQKTGYLYEPGGPLSPDGRCHAFDAKAQGTTIGNGVGIVVLKRVKDAIADGNCIYAVIKGAAINNDGSMKVGYTAPSVDGQAEAIAEAVMLAEVEPETISYIETHGSGTALGDPIEIAALTKVFRSSTERNNFCAIGSVKTNIGHLDAAAGVVGLIKTALALKHQLIPPSLNFEQPNPQIDFANSPFYVNTKLTAWETGSTPRRAGVSSLGMGGTNAHIVLEEAPTLPTSSPSRPWQLLVLSAKTESALETATQNLSQHLMLHPDLNLADVVYTLQMGRRDFNHRRILVCLDTQDAINALNEPASQQVVTQFQELGTCSVAFIFPGEGALYASMSKELYETELMFREQLDRCCLILQPHLELDLRSVIYPREAEQETALEKLKQTCYVQSALFVIEYALAQLWMSWGISPQAMIGQGIGEYVAATIAGVFSLEDVLALVAKEFSTELLQKTQLNPPTVPFISNVSGTWITQTEATNPNYWAQQQAVDFNKGINELVKDSQRILLEIGCGGTVSNKELSVLTSIPRPHEQYSDVAFLLNTLGKLWMLGIKIDWSGFYANERRHHLPLPTYPFERQRYWIEGEKQNDYHTVSLDKKTDIADWFYVPYWKQSTLLELFQKTKLVEQKLCWLVFVDTCGFGAEITERLKEEGQDVISVKVADNYAKLNDFTYTINPQQRDDYHNLLQALEEQNWTPQGIAHFWSLTSNDTLPSQGLSEQTHLQLQYQNFEDFQNLGFYSLLFLAQALAKQNITESIKLMVVTSHVHDITGSENLCPQKATILGPCKVIPQEYPNISCCCFDVVLSESETQPSGKLIDSLLREFVAQTTDNVVAYRGHHRWIQTYEPIRLNESFVGKNKLRKEGVYLITGGLGSVGLVLAEYLARTVQAKLILLGRKGLPGKDQWQEWLATHDEDNSISRKIRKVQGLLALGAEVLVISADVTNEQQMHDAIAIATQKFGAMNGVIHAAGEKAGCIIVESSKAQAQSQFSPKVYGLFVLEKVLQGQKLDFCTLTSSLSSVLGGLGFISYSAANIFMDAFVHNYNKTNPFPWSSFNWDDWVTEDEQQNTDVVDTSHKSLYKYGMRSKAASIDAFERVLSICGFPQVVVSSGDLQARLEEWIKLESLRTKELSNNENLFSKHQRPNIGIEYIAPRNKLEETVADIWQEILGIECIGIHDNFFELGGNSINAIQIAAKANQVGLNLIPQQFFEHQTIAELATILFMTQTIQVEQNLETKELHLTPIQHWFLEHNQPSPHHCNQSLLLEIQKICDPNLLEQALQHLIQHHDVFRLRFIQKESDWQQSYLKYHDKIELKRVSLSVLPETELKLAIESVGSELKSNLNLFEGPLVQFALFDIAPQRTNYLLIIIHHLAVDSVSWQILLEDLQTVYQLITLGKAINLPDTTMSYTQWTESLQKYAQSSEMMREQDYWLQEMEKSFKPLPIDHLTGNNKKAHTDIVSLCLNQQETKALMEEIHKVYNTQINDVLLTALVQAFGKWTGERKLRLDIIDNGREKNLKDINISRTVGCFTTCFPVVLDTIESSDQGNSLITIKDYLRSIANSGISYGILNYCRNKQKIQSKLRAFPQSEVSFSYLGQYDQMVSEPSLFALPQDSQAISYSKFTSQTYLLEIIGIVVQEEFQLHWIYNQAIHQRETIESLAENFLEALRSLIAHCQSVETVVYTPSDFPEANLSKQKLDQFLAKINKISKEEVNESRKY
jgi:non-ribosomal peptide synthase protein (TIGR01720 family)